MKRLPNAVFLDRDGVINEEVGLLYELGQMSLIPGSAAAVRRLNGLGLPTIVVTNQAVVAHGLCTETKLAEIHEELQRQLAEAAGASLSAIYYCPHIADAEVPEYRMACEDRKPGIGMFRKAAAEFGLDLRRCVMVGDRSGDIEAGQTAGCVTILVETGIAGHDSREGLLSPDYTCRDLAAAVELIEQGLFE